MVEEVKERRVESSEKERRVESSERRKKAESVCGID